VVLADALPRHGQVGTRIVLTLQPAIVYDTRAISFALPMDVVHVTRWVASEPKCVDGRARGVSS